MVLDMGIKIPESPTECLKCKYFSKYDKIDKTSFCSALKIVNFTEWFLKLDDCYLYKKLEKNKQFNSTLFDFAGIS